MGHDKSQAEEWESIVQTLVLDGEEHLGTQETFGLLHVPQQVPKLPEQSNSPPKVDSIQITDLPSISFDEQNTKAITAAPATSHELSFRGILGKGGLGEVFLAQQHALQRYVAIKRLRKEFNRDHQKRGLLVREGVLNGFLEHPNIVPVHMLGRDEQNRPILVMKRIEGASWRELISNPAHPLWESLLAEGDDPLQCHLNILTEICRALEFAHSRGIVHCDIKPANVMIGHFGEVYLLDWGIAQIVEEREAQAPQESGEEIDYRRLFGTPSYMAPEMVRGDFSTQTDVYLLGATLHECLTGHTRHQGESLKDVLYLAMESAPYVYDESVPADLAALCNQATTPDPTQRPEGAKAFRLLLAKHKQHRASYELSQQASARLVQMKQQIESLEAGQPTDDSLQVIFSECRFGYLQALREWDHNEAAKRGLRECLETMLDYHLTNDNLSAAKTLLSELSHPRQETQERIKALEESLVALRQKEVAYEELLREQNTEVSRTQRLIVTALLLCSVLFSPLLSRKFFGLKEYSYEMSLSILLFITTGVGGAIAIMRRALFKNRINRIFMAFLGIIFGFLWLHRLHAYAHHTPNLFVLRNDLLLMSGISFAFGSSVRVFWWIGGIFLLAFGLANLSPLHVKYCYGAAMIGNGLLFVRSFQAQSPTSTQEERATLN